MKKFLILMTVAMLVVCLTPNIAKAGGFFSNLLRSRNFIVNDGFGGAAIVRQPGLVESLLLRRSFNRGFVNNGFFGNGFINNGFNSNFVVSNRGFFGNRFNVVNVNPFASRTFVRGGRVFFNQGNVFRSRLNNGFLVNNFGRNRVFVNNFGRNRVFANNRGFRSNNVRFRDNGFRSNNVRFRSNGFRVSGSRQRAFFRSQGFRIRGGRAFRR